MSECLYVFVIQVLYSFLRFESVRFNRAWVRIQNPHCSRWAKAPLLDICYVAEIPPHFFGKICNCHLRLGLETEPTNVDSVDWCSPPKKTCAFKPIRPKNLSDMRPFGSAQRWKSMNRRDVDGNMTSAHWSSLWDHLGPKITAGCVFKCVHLSIWWLWNKCLSGRKLPFCKIT